MDRTKFYDVNTIEEITELDHLYNNLTKFKMVYPAGYYVVRQSDLIRPDLISYKSYGTVNFWWLLMMVNGIENIFTDLEVGLTLIIPNILDIYTFKKKWTMRT